MLNNATQVIVFDLVGVLFKVHKIKALRHIGHKDVLFYYLKNQKNPLDEGIFLMDKMRQDLPEQFQESMAYKGTYLPKCIVQWNQGVLSSDETFEQINSYFATLDTKGYFKSARHKRVVLNLLKAIFSPTLGIDAFVPIKSSLKLLEKLKKASQHKIYLLSNIDKETYEGIAQRYIHIFEQFDGVVTSYNSNHVKPDPKIFTYLFDKFNINPLNAFFIDDQIENLHTAQSLGMQTIHCTKPSHLSKQMKEKGLL